MIEIMREIWMCVVQGQEFERMFELVGSCIQNNLRKNRLGLKEILIGSRVLDEKTMERRR